MEIYNNHDGSTGKISTSKGNQIKMKVNGFWYKMDYLGYEGLSEWLCSELLAYTNINHYVSYEMTEMTLNGVRYNGCKSADFLEEGEEIITADRLFLLYTGKSAAEFLEQKHSLKERISSFVSRVEQITGIKDYGPILTQILEWDEFVLNDDRHFNNLAFVYNQKTKEFFPCPLFDNGAAFLSDLRYDYPLEKSIYGLIADVKAKPFSEDFDKQITVCEELYGIQLEIDNSISISEEMVQMICHQYGEKVTERICNIFDQQKSLCDYCTDYNVIHKSEALITHGLYR